MITAKILPYNLEHSLIGYKYEFELNCTKRGMINRFNILQEYNSRLDRQNNYIGSFLNILMSFAHVKNGHLVSTISGLQFHNLLNNSNYDANLRIANGIKCLYEDNILTNYKIING